MDVSLTETLVVFLVPTGVVAMAWGQANQRLVAVVAGVAFEALALLLYIGAAS